jgi:hypothetical protein
MTGMTSRRWWAVLAVPALMLGLSVAAAAPAAAAVGTITVDSDSRPNGGGDGVEAVTAECPAGSALIGSGWSVNARVIADEVVPDVTANTVRVEARVPDDGPAFANWSVTAKAICSTGIQNVARQEGRSDLDDLVSTSGVATCGFGTKVVGIGYAIETTLAPGQVHVTSVVPTATTVTVTAHEDDNGAKDAAGNDADWAVKAYAVCAAEPSGLSYVLSPSPANGYDHTTCPAPKKVIGAAGSLSSGFFDVSLNSMYTSVYGGFEIASAAGVEDDYGTNPAWSVATTAICASP